MDLVFGKMVDQAHRTIANCLISGYETDYLVVTVSWKWREEFEDFLEEMLHLRITSGWHSIRAKLWGVPALMQLVPVEVLGDSDFTITPVLLRSTYTHKSLKEDH